MTMLENTSDRRWLSTYLTHRRVPTRRWSLICWDSSASTDLSAITDLSVGEYRPMMITDLSQWLPTCLTCRRVATIDDYRSVELVGEYRPTMITDLSQWLPTCLTRQRVPTDDDYQPVWHVGKYRPVHDYWPVWPVREYRPTVNYRPVWPVGEYRPSMITDLSDKSVSKYWATDDNWPVDDYRPVSKSRLLAMFFSWMWWAALNQLIWHALWIRVHLRWTPHWTVFKHTKFLRLPFEWCVTLQ